jgi:hypothetical protein
MANPSTTNTGAVLFIIATKFAYADATAATLHAPHFSSTVIIFKFTHRRAGNIIAP